MAEDFNFENELANFLADNNTISFNGSENVVLPSTPPPPAPPAEKPKERILSQAEIDALLVSMMV
jgi:hypothetical protein